MKHKWLVIKYSYQTNTVIKKIVRTLKQKWNDKETQQTRNENKKRMESL